MYSTTISQPLILCVNTKQHSPIFNIILKNIFFQDQAIPGKGLPANLVSLMSKGALGATKLTKETSKMEPHQTPAERQQAAKLALRKQLEKTLLQVIF